MFDSNPINYLQEKVRNVLAHAVEAQRKNIKVYESLQNLNEVVGTEYGDRVLYELIQNAHDAHRPGDSGRISVSLTVHSENSGILNVANGGAGFRTKDVDAIMNLATTAKEIGESIGNKGLGFRSVEALTDNVQIYSRSAKVGSKRFDGYCFRFAERSEIEQRLHVEGVDLNTAHEVAQTVPRYLVPLPITEQSEEIVSYARRGYASVIVLPLRTTEAIKLARQQVQALADLEVPLLLFLDRITDIRIEVKSPDGLVQLRRLSRRQDHIASVPSIPGCNLHEVRVGDDRRFLMVQYKVEKERLIEAVNQSISRAPQIKRWLKWKGDPTVSVAVGLTKNALAEGRFYNFLPMGSTAIAPLLGYVEAPFFTDIDRRDADFELPLNRTLMMAIAEACAHAASYLTKQVDIEISQRPVFDLIAWTGEHASKLDAAFSEMGSSLVDAAIVPVVEVNGIRWARLTDAKCWPEGEFSLMKLRDVSKRTGALLVSTELDKARLQRLEAIARRNFLHMSPPVRLIAEWSERFAFSLHNQQAAPRTWSRFYEDLNRIFQAADEDLNELKGKQIILDRSKKLRRAGGNGDASRASVFVRDDNSNRRGNKGGVPLPPATLTRRYRFLDEKISIHRDTLNAFFDADLVRKYDPVEALAGLSSALGNRVNESRRREALTWAFSVWRSIGIGIHEALVSAQLHVPTSSGWQPAIQATFSSSWTPVGRILENFLSEAAEKSLDCERTRETLLADFGAWPRVQGDTKRQWIEFLKMLGVVDGLRPVAAGVQAEGKGWNWTNLTYHGDAKQGLDEDWCREASNFTFRYPYTEYQRKGEIWRLPGQLEHVELSAIGKDLFQELAFRHLESFNSQYLTFEVGRFERASRNWDRNILPTLIATFLRSKAWIAVDSNEDQQFRKAKECWATRSKTDRMPRFIEHVSEPISELVQGSEEFAELIFGEALMVRDWYSSDTSSERLQALAVVASSLRTHHRAEFRKEYRRAWLEISNTDESLPNNLELAVVRDGGLETLAGDSRTQPKVIVTQNAQESTSRILSSSGHALLDVGDASAERVSALLVATGEFSAQSMDGNGVRLLVDGEPFVPRSTDPQFSSEQLAWLPEVVLLGHEILAEGLERGVQRTTVERRIRAIRIRRCLSISLVVDGNEVSPQRVMNWYGVEHAQLPTLILTKNVSLSWLTLSRDLATTLERLLDRRFRFLEPLLLRLYQSQNEDTLHPPSDRELASALRCDLDTLHEHRAAMRTDLGHVLDLLIPVVGYFQNIEIARQLIKDVERDPDRFDVSKWLESYFSSTDLTIPNLIASCERAPNLAALRRDLELGFERFNLVLLALDVPPISNEDELRSMYDAYLRQMQSEVTDRLRRHHAADFWEGRDLAVYIERKSLAFLEFDPSWVLSRETLDNETVKAHVARSLNEILGEDKGIELPSLRGLLDKNRKLIRDFATRAISIVGAWCRKAEIAIPDLWITEDPQLITRHLENSGLLDFDQIDDQQIPELCHRADCWPAGMDLTLATEALGLDPSTVESEARLRQRERELRIIEERSIDFAGTRLDPGDPSFAETFQSLAERNINNDESWLGRSRRPRLAEFGEFGVRSRLPIGNTDLRTGRRRQQLPDDQREAMGMASEWLVFQYLRRQNDAGIDESCWVSRNRSRFFAGDEGDDTLGYDFCVKTPRAEWLYEVKSSLADTREFELTSNEMRVAASIPTRGRRRYRILYVPFVFSPDRWMVLELPNPMGEDTRNRYKQVGRGSVRFQFEMPAVNRFS